MSKIRIGGVVQPNEIICPFCKDKMTKLKVSEQETQQFACPNCGFLANFVASDTGFLNDVRIK